MVTYSVGRGRANDIVVDDSSVSRRHAEIRIPDDVDADAIVLVDLGSTNGTCVRDEDRWVEVEKASVAGNERILLGEVVTTVSALLERRKPPSRKLAVRPMAGSSDRTAPGRPLSERLSALRRLTGERSDHARVIGRPRRDNVDVASLMSSRVEPTPPSRGPIAHQGVAARINKGDPARAPEQPSQEPQLDVSTRAGTRLESTRQPSSLAVVGTGDRRTALVHAGATPPLTKWAAISAVSVIVAAAATLALVRYGNALIGNPLSQLAAGTNPHEPASALAGKVIARPKPAETEWRRFLGGNGNDTLTAGARYRDGSVILIGSSATETENAKSRGIWVVRLDSTGRALWQRRHVSGASDNGLAVAATKDGGSVVAGTTDDGTVALLLRLNANGDRLWSRKIAVEKRSAVVMIDARSRGEVTALLVARDAKTNRTRTQILRLDSGGKIVWRRDLGKGDVWGTDLRRMRDGGFVIAGIRRPSKSRRPTLWVARTDEKGKVRWSRTLASTGSDTRAQVRIARHEDIIAATTHLPRGDKSGPTYRLVRLTRKGGKRWDYIGHGLTGIRVRGLYLVKRAIVVAGAARLSTPHAMSPWLARIGVDGKLDWQRRFDNLAPAGFKSIVGRADQGFILAGSIQRGALRGTDALVMFLNPSGHPGL